ncbi:MAG: peroxiredoxin [Parachlamydiaceae bacterium]|nr:peroxiredoxin [Parachlamydiaceae bacterium]
MTVELKIGDIAPDFNAETTEGPIKFHEWLDRSWGIFFSHPKDFTPVCTTELGVAAKLKKEFDQRQTKMIALSVNPLNTHQEWVKDICETQQVKMNFPIIADENGNIARLYGMIHPHVNETITVRSVFIIDPQKKVRLTFCYPPSTGRNFKEILRVLDSLQLTDSYKVATPANWEWGQECVILPSITNPEELNKYFPNGYRELKPYLRMTPQPNIETLKK